MSGVKIRVRADAAQASREIGKLEKSVVSLDKRATAVSKSFRNLAVGITAAFTGGALTKSITRSADSMTDFGNRVNLVTRDVQKTKVVMDELFKIAARSRGSVDAAAETFNRFGLALQDANKPVSY
jgi:methyl-accepting chemotaxis protein